MSASVIGALRVNLGLDSAQFSRGVGSANSSLAKFAAKAGAIAGSLAATMKTAFVSMGMSAIDAGTQIDRLSQLTSTAPAQFQGWAAGAKSVGIEQEKLADILKDTNDRIGDYVQTGGGPMADFFENIAPKVGITAAAFRNLSGADALQLYVSSLEKANVNQQDFTFYMEAMASDSTLLLPLLKNGGQSMADYADRAQRMGAIMGGPMLASLREGKSALADMNLAIDGMRNTIGALAVPAIKALSAAIRAAAIFFHTHADTIASVMRTLAGVAMVVAAAFAIRYATAIGITAVRAMMSAIQQSIALEMALGAQSRAAALASVATKGLAGALGLLRRALIATGIGAAVVAAGYLVGKFLELVQVTGGFGAALSALGELSGLVWQGIIDSAAAIPPGLSAVWSLVKADFLGMLAELQARWATFLTGMSNKVQSSPTLNALFGDSLAGVAEDAITKWEELAAAQEAAAAAAAASAQDAADIVSDAFAPAAEAWARRRETVEEGIIPPEIPAAAATSLGDVGNSADGAGKKAEAAAEKMSDLRRVLTGLREEADKLKATMNMSEADAAVWSNQRDAGVSANSAAGKEIDSLTRATEGMKQLKEASDDWKNSLSTGFSELARGASSFSDVLSNILGKLADMIFSQGFDMLWNGGGLGGLVTGGLSALGIGANANGTRNWRGGLTRLNERGGEILNLPRGTQVIPHDISKRMADGAAGGGHMRVSLSPELVGEVLDQAGQNSMRIVQEAAPGIRRAAVSTVQRGSAKTKSFLGSHG